MNTTNPSSCFGSHPHPPKIISPIFRTSGVTIQWMHIEGSAPAKSYILCWKVQSWWTHNTENVRSQNTEIEEFSIVDQIAAGETIRCWIYTVSHFGTSKSSEVAQFTRPISIFTAVYDRQLEQCQQIFYETPALDRGRLLSNLDVDGNTLCHWAALVGDSRELKWLHKNGSSLCTPVKPFNMQPIHWLCVQRRGEKNANEIDLVDCLQYLNKQKVDINALTTKNRTPLILAIQSSLSEVAEFLIKIGADINQCDINGDNVLHWAAYFGNCRIVQLLLEKGMPIYKQDNFGQTALHIACLQAKVEVCKILVDFGGIELIEIKDRENKMAIELTIEEEIISLISQKVQQTKQIGKKVEEQKVGEQESEQESEQEVEQQQVEQQQEHEQNEVEQQVEQQQVEQQQEHEQNEVEQEKEKQKYLTTEEDDAQGQKQKPSEDFL